MCPKKGDDLDNNQSEVKTQILHNLEQLRTHGEESTQNIKNFHEALNASSSFKEFHKTVKDIVTYGQSLSAKLFPEGEHPGPHIMHAVYKEVEKDKDLHSILDSINYVETFYADTVGNKERLSKEELEEQLSPEEFRVLVSCIRNIVALKPVADLIADKVEDFKNRLEDAQSLEEVEDIESEIAILQQSLDRTYQQSVHFPQDEKTAGALIEYLDFNHHIRKIAEAFNVQGKLTDDVLYATGRCQMNLKF